MHCIMLVPMSLHCSTTLMLTIHQLVQQYIEYNSVTYCFCLFSCIEDVEQFDIGPKEYQELEVKPVHSPVESLKEKALSLNFGNKSTCKLHRDNPRVHTTLLVSYVVHGGCSHNVQEESRCCIYMRTRISSPICNLFKLLPEDV